MNEVLQETDAPTREPRALFVTTVPLTITAFLLPFASLLKKKNWRVDCLSSQASSWPGLEIFDEIHDIGWSRSARSFLHYKEFATQIVALVEKNGYDIIHVHTPLAAFITRRALRNLKKTEHAPKIIYTAHGFHFYEGQTSRFAHALYKSMERAALPWTDTLVVMNDEDEKAARNLAAGKHRCRVVRIDGIGFDFDDFAEVYAKNHARRNKTIEAYSDGSYPRTSFEIDVRSTEQKTPVTLCMIAEMNDNKNHKLLLEALILLHESNDPSFFLTLVGTGENEERLKKFVKDSCLRDCVAFAGYVESEELKRIIAATDIGLLVSDREGLPRSLMELCAGGALIGGTHTRGIVDEVIDPRALAGYHTAASVADMLDTLIHNTGERFAIAEAQYAHARKHYDLPVILANYEMLYEQSSNFSGTATRRRPARR